ncbi:hypothetical protein BSZ36_01355 [Rubricoccus marinus]|uniref:FTP domain-containing protein n=2 Tax=Rubricoccus marinus TaxID=716817 RepID=A0A259TVF5_9BACT|nr:hypothetical protein BSZ36_01355 [Rubricoccus marinus]
MSVRFAAVALALLLPALASAQSLAEQTAVRYLQNNWNRHSLQQADVSDLVVTDEVPGLNGIQHVYLRQAIGGIEVASGPLSVGIDRHGRVFHAAGRLTSGVAQKRGSATASLSPEAAVMALAQASGVAPRTAFTAVSQKGGASRETVLSDGGVTRLPVRARLVYAEDGGRLTLAWETTLFLKDGGDWFGHIDAATGRVIRMEDRLVSELYPVHGPAPARAPEASRASGPAPMVPFAVQAAKALASGARGGATYRAYPMPIESPLYSDPVAPGDARILISGMEDAIASPFGWHDTDGVAGAEFTTTRGNNTHAYLDRDDDEEPDANGEPDGGESLTFDFPLDFALSPELNKDASVVNLFYWSNIVHDVMYRYGFDEASGNFQANNYGNGGAGGDAVDSESQSGADICNEFSPCDTNANFSTPPDGQEPRMQMYIGSNPTPDIDGSFDHTVVAHEYGHGISTRLTGGPSNVGCLRNDEQMGEGWSDFFGLIMTIEPGDTGADRRPVGNYLIGQPVSGNGIRSAPFQPSPGAPYSTDFSVNSATYGATNGGLSAPHGVGFVWSQILWEVTWEMIEEHGWDPDLYNASGTAGNQMMLALVMEGLKLQPCSPGFVDGRDAILAADQALYNGENTEILWRGFARRGLGLTARQGSSASRSDQVESFVEPEENPPAAITDLSATANGDFATLRFTATGDDGTVGTAAEYFVRTSASPILTEEDWAGATPRMATGTPQVSGTPEAIELLGLDFATTYHVAVKAIDESFNLSPLSNSVEFTTLAAPDVEVASDVIAFEAEVGGTAEATLDIQNTGEGDLRFSLSLAASSSATARHHAAYAAGAATRLAAAPERDPTPEAKEARQASGVAPKSQGSGGPDAFGYTWTDSDEAGGPAFDWVDISETGTAISLGDDDSQQVLLPFTFSFYGEDQTAVYIGSNGILSFGATDSDSYTNDPIPTADTPNAMIAAYWDDLNPSLRGRVLHQDMGDGRFVVTYEDVPHYNLSGEVSTFQVILSQSGAIVFQYLTMKDDVSDPTSHTIGVENADGTDGLQIVNNAAYVHDELAIRLSAFWGDAPTATGRIAGGGSQTVTLRADAAGLAVGVYDGVLTIASNDPDEAVTTVPLQLTVGNPNAPLASVTPGSVTQDVPRGETQEATLTIANAGGVALDWSLADASGTLPSWLSLSAASGEVAPGASVDVTATLAPGVEFNAGSTQTTTLVLTSNDPNGTVSVDVSMNVLAGVANEDGLDFDGPYVLSEVAPNPVGRSATATFAVRESQNVTIDVLDLLGRRVASVHSGPVAGMTRQVVEIDASRLASGAYVLVLRGETFATSRRITVAR